MSRAAYPDPHTSPGPAPVEVAVVGAGFSGLGAGARLKQAGIDDFVVLERAADVGGTWRDNDYPGATCDVPSHLYSFSFHPNPRWSRSFSGQPEIHAYLRGCVDAFGIRSHLRLEHEVTSAVWDARAARWTVLTPRGGYRARHLVVATGPLSDPSLPDLPGLDGFRGPVFHSSRWDHSADLTGRQVAVVGTGASAIQFVPRIQPQVARLDLYQRTPPWVLPRHDRSITRAEQRLYTRFPALQQAVRNAVFWGRESYLLGFVGGHDRITRALETAARAHLRRAVRDPGLRARLTPDFRLGCKRVLISDDYYPALARPNVELVTDGIAEVRPRSVVTADGTERDTDAIVLATGFRTTELPVAERITGRGGVLLADAWRGGMEAHQACTVTGFPNLFFTIGPNSGLGHSSMTLILEAQIRYAVDCVRWARDRGVAEVEVLPGTQAAYNERLQARMADTVWTTGGCTSWYLDPRTGRNTTLWPDYVWRFQRMNRRFDPAGHRVRTLEQVAAEAGRPATQPA